jgi:hypothetical protein
VKNPRADAIQSSTSGTNASSKSTIRTHIDYRQWPTRALKVDDESTTCAGRVDGPQPVILIIVDIDILLYLVNTRVAGLALG